MSARGLGSTRGRGAGADALRWVLPVVLALLALMVAPAVSRAEETCPNAGFRVGASAHLPDCRAYEMVTPPYKEGYAIQLNKAAEDREGVLGAGEGMLGESVGTFAGSVSPPSVIEDFGNLGRFDPDTINTQNVFQITPSGNIKVAATGLSKVLGIAFDQRARMYVLET